MLRIGLTGGIGSGKSAVAARLASRGASVVDADLIARQVVGPGSEGLAALVDAFGEQILDPDGALDRPRLGEVVFGDDDKRATLNAVVHPLVGRETWARVQQAEADGVAVVVQDIPLLVEGRMGAAFPLVVVVDAPVEQRLARLLARSGMDADQARARMRAQASTDQRRAAADVWIDNAGSLVDLHRVVDALWDARLLPFADNLAAGRRAARPASPVLVEPDPGWEAEAARVLARVRLAAGERALAVEHIGSTAVPGLAAKDVLDVMVVTSDLAGAAEVAEALPAAGLVRLEGEWCDELPDGGTTPKVFAANADPGRAVNCHVRPESSPAVRAALLFRDHLRASPGAASAYLRLKQRLAVEHQGAVEEYAHAKGAFVRKTVAEAQRRQS